MPCTALSAGTCTSLSTARPQQGLRPCNRGTCTAHTCPYSQPCYVGYVGYTPCTACQATRPRSPAINPQGRHCGEAQRDMPRMMEISLPVGYAHNWPKRLGPLCGKTITPAAPPASWPPAAPPLCPVHTPSCHTAEPAAPAHPNPVQQPGQQQ